MPKKKIATEKVACTYFDWGLYLREGVYYAHGHAGGKRVRQSLGTRDRDEAKRKLAEFDALRAVKCGRAPPQVLQAVGTSASRLPLAEGVELFMQARCGPAVRGGLAPTSAKSYRQALEEFAAFAVSARLASAWEDVTDRVFERYVDHLVEQGRAENTIYRKGNQVKEIVKWLRREEHAPGLREIAIELRRNREPGNYCFTDAEVVAQLGHCRADPKLGWMHDALLVAAETGLRRENLCALRWSDIDLTGGMITLAHAPEAGRRIKNGRRLTFPMGTGLSNFLTRLPHREDGLVLSGPRGGRLDGDTLLNAYKARVRDPLAEKFPVRPGERYGFADAVLHSFRHYFISRCARSGVPQPVVSAWVGHSSSRMIQHYFTLYADESRAIRQRLPSIVATPAEA